MQKCVLSFNGFILVKGLLRHTCILLESQVSTTPLQSLMEALCSLRNGVTARAHQALHVSWLSCAFIPSSGLHHGPKIWGFAGVPMSHRGKVVPREVKQHAEITQPMQGRLDLAAESVLLHPNHRTSLQVNVAQTQIYSSGLKTPWGQGSLWLLSPWNET